MSRPIVDAPLRALHAIADVLDRLGRPFALVGGLAVSVRGEVRFTRDVDLAIASGDDVESERLVHALREAGYETVAVVEQAATGRLATVRLASPTGIVVDLLLASCGIEPEVVSRAEPIDIGGRLLGVARAEDLLAMKVLSSSRRRRKDVEDALGLLRCNPELDLAAVRSNLALIEERGYARQQDLAAKLTDLLAELADD